MTYDDKAKHQLQRELARLRQLITPAEKDHGFMSVSSEGRSSTGQFSSGSTGSFFSFSPRHKKPISHQPQYHLSDLVDMALLYQLLDSFYKTTGIPYSIIDNNNNVLRGSGWQDICTQFHRVCPQTVQRCVTSDSYIATHWQDGPYVGYTCLNGLMDYAAPIIVEGQYLGGIFSGQFFHRPPDEEHFREQAKKYGFNETAYMEALGRVPIVPEDQIESAMEFFSQLGQILATIGLERKGRMDSADQAIRECDDRLRLVWNTSNDGFWDWNLQSGHIYISPRLAEILGYSPEEYNEIIHDWINSVHPDDIAIELKALREHLEGKADKFEAEYRIRTRSGEWKWVLDRGQIVARDQEGRPLRMAGTKLDLTARKQAEITLLQSEEKFSKAFHCNPDLMAISTLKEGRYVDVNDAFARHTGYARHETIGRTVEDLNIWAVPGQRDHLSSLLMQGGSISGFELQLRLKSGEIRTFSLSGEIIYIDGEAHLLNVSRDITDSKRMVEQMRLSEECFSKAFNVSPIMMTISTLEEGRYLKVNNAFCVITGYSREEVIGRTSLKIGFWKDPEERHLMKQRMKFHQSIHDAEFWFCKKNGEQGLGVYSAELIDVDGEPCLLSVLTDITQLRQMEAEMTRLDRLNVVGEIAASIGHEIRNPMTTVRGYLQLLRENKDYSQEVEHFDLMIEELDRANTIITEFLSLAKDKIVELESENLNTMIHKLLPLVEAKAMIRDQGVNLELTDLPDLLLDKKEIRQLILNLVNNGLESMSSSGNVTIKTFVDKNNVVLGVQDQGHGIQRDLLHKLGTPFLTTKEHGNGLGLAVCYRIAARHNAKIDLETSASGTTFFIRFPIQ